MMPFVRRTLVGGLLVVVPAVVVLIVLKRVVTTVHAGLQPLEAILPVNALFPGMWAVLLLVGASFMAGLTLQLGRVRRRATALDGWLGARFPFYRFLSDMGGHLLDGRGDRPVKAALAEIEDALVPAFVVEELADGRYVVFVPSVPSPVQGAIYILARARVHLVAASLAQVVRCVSHWGVGSGELVTAIEGNPGRPR